VVGRWIIIARARAARPSDFVKAKKEEIKEGKVCPFCPGNESLTPPEVFARRQANTLPNQPGWQVRVVPNRFPALIIESELKRQGEGIYDRMSGTGAHEVIIETPDHNSQLADLDENQIYEVICTYRDRVLDLIKDNRFKYVIVFKNHGVTAGASLSHSHSQLIAMPVVPNQVKEELDGSQRYFDFRQRCIFCDILKQELEDSTRLVTQNEKFVAISPYAPRFPFETWIIARRHFASFAAIDDSELKDLAQILKSTLNRMNRALSKPDYNFLIHIAPSDNPEPDYYHFHLEVMPKLTKIAGFEVGSGFYINPTPPEDAAKYLREV
jgi:UDPglucose--hexose-1-phosphate uridylyltransferase